MSIFDREKYESLEILTFEVTCVGEVKLPNGEEKILKMHPKLAIMENTGCRERRN